MNDYKKSLWTSTLITLLIALALIIATKSAFNTILLEQQQLPKTYSQLALLPTITSIGELEESLELSQFSYIKINNSRLNSPLVYSQKAVNQLFNNLLPSPISNFNSPTENQSIQYTSVHAELFKLYQSIIVLIVSALIITLLLYHTISFRVLKKIESALVNEIVNEKSKITPFKKVTIELIEQRRLFDSALHSKKEKISLLSQQINADSLTGLNNRHVFRKELTEFLSDESNRKHAILSIIRLFELSVVNMHRGFQQGDQFVVNVANIINDVLDKYKDIHLFRISGSEFAFISHSMSIGDAQQLANELKLKFDQYQLLNNLENVAFNGMTLISSNQLPEHVLARADIALAKAQTSGINAWAFEENIDNQTLQVGEQHWRSIITDIITNRSFTFLQQPVQAIHRNMKGYQEIFTRFVSEHNNTIPTDTVFSMAQRTDTIIKLEKIILEKIIYRSRLRTEYSTRWGINLSSSAMHNSSFMVWLERLLLREPDVAGSLVFEVPESLLGHNLIASKRVFNMLKRAGSRSAICNFGKGISSFRLFEELKPDYIKLDASLITNLESDSANQQFIRMIIDVAHRMECQVIAEGIEHLEQKQILESMYIDGIQGYLIAEPTPL
ncbi:EAL domain-containing protein [uncultured Psychromonas sp.]|uniref:EAL domain-containing protein n=1 Tax=uncultured Psychromonas sp. TaxID=173974 RepID=UPI00260BABB1|nr:EAL domain-containing protein [uncultured Psychromonas sp.]